MIIVAALVTLCPGRPASAQTVSTGGLTPSVEVGLASDYLFRGIDQTRGRGEAFGGAQVDGPASRYGIWTSNVVVPSGAGAVDQAEVDLYGGWLTSLAGFDVDLGADGYVFSGARSRPDLIELYARLARTLGPVRFALAAHYGPAGQRGARDGYAELSASYPVTPKWTLSGALGHSYESRAGVLDAFEADAPARGFNATVWDVGASYSVNDRIALELSWSDIDRSGPAYPSRVFATLRAKLF